MCCFFWFCIRRHQVKRAKKNNDDKISLLHGKVLFIPPSLLFCVFFLCVRAKWLFRSLSDKANADNCLKWKMNETHWNAGQAQRNKTQSRTNEWWWTTVDHRKLSLEDKTDKGSNEVERLICIQLFHYIDILCQRFVHCIYFRTTQRKERIERNERKKKTWKNEQRLWDFVFTITFFFSM